MDPAKQLEGIKQKALDIQSKLNANKAGAAKPVEVPPVTPVVDQDGAVAAETLTSGGTPELPEPTANTAQDIFQTSVSEQATQARTELESTIKTERDAALKRQDDLNKKLEKLMQEQNPEKRATFEQEQRVVQNQLDAAETASASLEEDFTKRRKTVSELDALLTQGNQLIEQSRNAPITKYRSRNVAQEMQNVQARAGVLQAVISGVDGNINFAHSIINNASNAVASVWNDQLAYNQAYMSLVENGELSKNKIQDDYALSQIALAENKLKQLDQTKAYIQELMIDPASAQFIADAGITLNDSVEEINTKMQEQTSKQEREDTINELTMDGYEYVPFAEGRDDVVTLEVGGKTLAFVPPAEPVKTQKGSGSGSGLDIEFTPSETKKIMGAGFSAEEAAIIEQSINEFGVAATLAGIENQEQQAALAEILNAEAVLDQVLTKPATPEDMVTDIMDAITDEQLKAMKVMADEVGVSSFWTGKKKDVKRFLNTPEMQEVIKAGIEQGLTQSEIIDAITS